MVSIMESGSQDKTRKATTTETCKVIYTKVFKDRSVLGYYLVLFPFFCAASFLPSNVYLLIDPLQDPDREQLNHYNKQLQQSLSFILI